MIPLKLTLRGFLTYRDEETLDFENVRTAVIIGENGHGKSALFDAVTYALFGKHRGSQTRHLVNQECRELAVRFEFEADGRRYRVDRALTLSPRKNGVPAPVATGLVWDGIDWQAVAHGVGECDAWVKDVLGSMTYEICCQSILLRQGAHDLFLSAKPTERQLVLNTLLNLEPYRRLQQAALKTKGVARGVANGIEGRLSDLVAHDVETIDRLKAGLASALEQLEQAELTQTTAKGRLDASMRYWELEESVKVVAAELQGKQQLLSISAKVRAAHRRRTDLEGAIPLLRAAHDAEVAAIAAESGAAAARVALGSLNLEARGATLRLAAAEAALRETEYTTASDRAGGLSREREDLRPKATLLVAADGQRAAAEQHRLQAEELAAEAARAPQARAEATRLAGLKTALPWLRQVATGKNSIADLAVKIVGLRETLSTEQGRTAEDDDAIATAKSEADDAAQKKRAADGRLIGALQAIGGLEEQLAHRHEASDEQICTHCGQSIDPAQVAREILGLEARLVDVRSEETAARAALALAETADVQAVAGLATAEATKRERVTRIVELQRDLGQAQKDRDIAESRIAEACLNLDETIVIRMRAEAEYPTPSSLSAVELETRGYEAAAQRTQKAGEAATRHGQLEALMRAALERTDELEVKVPAIERAFVRDRWSAIDGECGEAEQARQKAEQTWREADGAKQQAAAAMQADEQAASTHKAEIRAKEELAQTHRATRTSLLARTPQDLHLDPLTAEAIEVIATESANLKPLADRLDELASAPEDVARLDGQRVTLDSEIAKIAAEDRRDVDIAEAEWKAAGVVVDERRTLQQKAQADLNRSREDAEKARGLEALLLDARTREDDAKLLDNLLGVQHLQGRLVEAARVGITDAANRELDAISRGTLRLEMHRKVKANGQEADIELLVLDRMAVREPIDAAYLSGSQRFRVAVALALGIGQYVGGAARGQRAVIIDEGFGSLDADGIDAMAEHLRDLSDRLDRVILVTHQPEMRKHFAEGFVVKRENGTSKVTPWPTSRVSAEGAAAMLGSAL